MRKIKIIGCILILLILLSGCRQINTINKETYDQLVDYHNSIGKKCIEYINNDSSLSNRSKVTLQRKYELMDQLIKSQLIVEND